MEKYLSIFQNDEYLREAVKQFFLQQADKVALEYVFERKNTLAVADAKDIIEEVFIELSELYGKDKKQSVDSPR